MNESFRRIRYLLNRRRFDQELAGDMEFHREMAARAGAERGHFGNTLLLREEAGSAEGPFWQAFDALRLALNETLQLGLFSFEAHYALYPPGASYGRHLDRFRAGADSPDVRVISCVIYLTVDWTPADGGVLRIHDGERMRDVLPLAGKLVCFLSDRFEHEVLPATRERLSLTGWFRRRA